MIDDNSPDTSLNQTAPVSQDLSWHASKVTRASRAQLLRQQPTTVWLTGLSGAGKSTIAFELERQLMASDCLSFVMDGDNIRQGLNRDLGFSPEDRCENIRRVAEVAKLFNDAGLVVITSFISPYQQDRALARDIIGASRFLEVHLCTDIAVCEQRDPKGLYKKVRQGGIAEFTGISAPYETPQQAALTLDTAELTLEQSVARILQLLMGRLQPL